MGAVKSTQMIFKSIRLEIPGRKGGEGGRDGTQGFCQLPEVVEMGRTAEEPAGQLEAVSTWKSQMAE